MVGSTSSPRSYIDERWTTQDAAELYGLKAWGQGYFGVREDGHLVCTPGKDPSRFIDLHAVLEELSGRGLTAPVLLRFDDLLQHRLIELRDTFQRELVAQNYGGSYTCVYPVKVNQQRHLLEQLLGLNKQLGFGFEAGSKPELLSVLGLTADANGMPVVCNGFKDDEFIETAILATKLGRNTLIVVEKFSELEMIVGHADRYGVRPRIGLRAKLTSRGAGRWQGSGGLRSKFGLTTSEMLDAVDYLKRSEMLDCVRMLHCHLGSQISDIRHFKNAVTELAYIYVELLRLGASCDTIDLGGGLAVDYDGSGSSFPSSVNYSIREYAEDVIYRVKNVCDNAGVDHPNLMTESGRYLTAHSSCLITNVLGRSRFDVVPNIGRIEADLDALPEDERPQPLLDLLEAWRELHDRNLLQIYHDVTQARDESKTLFSLGYMSLPMRASCEKLFWAIGQKIMERARRTGLKAEEFEGLPELLSDIYFLNFSVFQSMPDSWAIGQLFPICPIHRLDETPTRKAVLADITCDSDGKVDRFVSTREQKKTLELHDLVEGDSYYLGIFMLGAYQEVLGDLHNLFGDTHVVHVCLDAEKGWRIDEVVEGDTVREVLGYVGFDVNSLNRTLQKDVAAAVSKGALTDSEGDALTRFYESGLKGYTYLE